MINACPTEFDAELVGTLSNLRLPPQYGIVGVLQFKQNEAGPLMDFLFAVRFARLEARFR
jgi:hypothetical protein